MQSLSFRDFFGRFLLEILRYLPHGNQVNPKIDRDIAKIVSYKTIINPSLPFIQLAI